MKYIIVKFSKTKISPKYNLPNKQIKAIIFINLYNPY